MQGVLFSKLFRTQNFFGRGRRGGGVCSVFILFFYFFNATTSNFKLEIKQIVDDF
jgi:hypothetical protein